MFTNIVLLCSAVLSAYVLEWKMVSPFSGEPDVNQEVPLKSNNNRLYDAHHGIAMGVEDPNCDDAKVNLKVDWFMNPENYTCYEDKRLYAPKTTVHPIHSLEHIPVSYSAPHKCMNESIEYSEAIPTLEFTTGLNIVYCLSERSKSKYKVMLVDEIDIVLSHLEVLRGRGTLQLLSGTHRPLWAVYGEYTFLPRQRWIHNLEHGGVVMLYHPCANKNQVNTLRNLVKSCLYRHVITPYNLLSLDRPLALVTWGHRLEMSKVASEIVVDFIKKHALHGPEKTHRDGQYSLMLEEHANVVSNIEDSNLCPNYENINM
ncbi:hypothetical protein NQ314_002691 [Rhamnusium bicolor]|uniref:Uncharacterized protein n=1 Tax=Rhamnusium bicolor TaxID=1586634 RepID=A0AAV8ZQT2_9CUCU|nr:hypothetical protein NQ314_002691 [Rhamnusium bicolor]